MRAIWSLIVVGLLSSCTVSSPQVAATASPIPVVPTVVTPYPTYTPFPTAIASATTVHPNGATSISTSSDIWKTYKADSGYEIRYPLETYSVRSTARASVKVAQVIYPGPKVLEPNDSFFYRDPGALTYKISIAVGVNDLAWSLDRNPEQLLAENLIAAYNPASLTGHPIQRVTLGGEKAIRVDNVQEGPLNITIQIVVIHNSFIYDLLVEPQDLPANQAEPYVPKVQVSANRELYEKMLATFKFSD